jgi:hypothetical protein
MSSVFDCFRTHTIALDLRKSSFWAPGGEAVNYELTRSALSG